MFDRMPGALEIPSNQIGDVLAVFDDENAGHGGILLKSS